MFLQSFDEEQRIKEELIEQSHKGEEIDKIKSELEISVAEKEKALTEYQLSAKEKNELNLRLQEARMEAQTLKADLERMSKEKLESDQLLQTSIHRDQVEQRVNEKEKLIEKLKKKLREMRAEAKEMTETLNISKVTEKEMETVKLRLEEKVQELEAKLERALSNEKETIAALTNNFEKEITEKETFCENLVSNLRGTQSKLQEIASTKELLQYQLIQAENEHKDLQKEQEHIISGLRNDLDRARHEGSKDLQAKMNALLVDKDDLQKLLHEKENALISLKKEYSDVEQELKMDLEKVRVQIRNCLFSAFSFSHKIVSSNIGNYVLSFPKTFFVSLNSAIELSTSLS